MAVPSGAPERTTNPWGCHSLAGSKQGHLQDRGLSNRGSSVGTQKEPSGNELRQVVQVHSPVLQKRHHEEDGTVTAIGLPILHPVLLVIAKLVLDLVRIFINRVSGTEGDSPQLLVK